MNIETFDIPGLMLIRPKRFGDRRGFFAETYSARNFAQAGIQTVFVQDNHARSAEAGTVRGLHFQLPPFAQTKLVWVIRGRALDVVVDLRQGSPGFGRHAAIELSAEDGAQLLVPAGFAHGYCTLEPDTELYYKVDAFYSPAHDRGVLWNDPALGIDWPIPDPAQAILSDKDRCQPVLADLPPYFTFES